MNKNGYVIVGLIVALIVSNMIGYLSFKSTKEDFENQLKEKEVFISNLEKEYTELQANYINLTARSERLESRLKESKCSYTKEEINLLAQCVEAEAGYNSESQKYVTQVILNRVNSTKYPDTIKEVIYQKTSNGVEQFSVAYNGTMKRIKVKPETLVNVYSVLLYGTDLPEYVQYFYSEKVTDNWVNTLNIYKSVGGTVFAYASKEVY